MVSSTGQVASPSTLPHDGLRPVDRGSDTQAPGAPVPASARPQGRERGHNPLQHAPIRAPGGSCAVPERDKRGFMARRTGHSLLRPRTSSSLSSFATLGSQPPGGTGRSCHAASRPTGKAAGRVTKLSCAAGRETPFLDPSVNRVLGQRQVSAYALNPDPAFCRRPEQRRFGRVPKECPALFPDEIGTPLRFAEGRHLLLDGLSRP